MNTAIIVAAGGGKRFDSSVPKQFLEILGKPVILHALDRFEDCAAIDQIIVVVPADHLERFSRMADPRRYTKLDRAVAGGATRAASVRNGFLSVDPSTALVCVHDGVRPLVTEDEIERTLAAAAETGAACLVAPVTDTIKSVEDGIITGTIDRDGLRRALTPQAFRYETFQRMVEAANQDVTDECRLAESIGIRVAIVEGNSRNIKITHAEDLVMAESILLKAGK